MHLLIDGYECDAAQLADQEHVRRFLDEFPGAISMTKITEPSVHLYHGPVAQDWGVSGFVIIAESHISVHTFPDRAYVNIDVFSCMEFDADAALAQVRERFAMGTVKHWVLDRGLVHLDPSTARQAVEAERAALARAPSRP